MSSVCAALSLRLCLGSRRPLLLLPFLALCLLPFLALCLHFAAVNLAVAIGIERVEVFEQSLCIRAHRFLAGDGTVAIGIELLELRTPLFFALFVALAEFFLGNFTVAVSVDGREVLDDSLGSGGLSFGQGNDLIAVAVDSGKSLAFGFAVSGLGVGDGREDKSCAQAEECMGLFHIGIAYYSGFAAR